MLALAASTPLVKWDAIGKVLLAGLVGGVGVVIAFGFLIFGVARARRTNRESTRIFDYSMSAVCGVFCLAAVAIGIYAMVTKPKTPQSSAKGKAKIAVVDSAWRLPPSG